MLSLTSPRHTSTLPTPAVPVSVDSSHLSILTCGTKSRRSSPPRSGRSARPKLLRVPLSPGHGPARRRKPRPTHHDWVARAKPCAGPGHILFLGGNKTAARAYGFAMPRIEQARLKAS
jgi:hypothetical protein